MAILNLTKTTTVEALRKEFNDAFGAQVKLYNGNKKAEPGDTLEALGLAEDGTFECRSSLTVASFIERMAERGLKVKVYTCDEWVAVLDGLTLESAGKVKKNAVKADMESMIAYQRKDSDLQGYAIEAREDGGYIVRKDGVVCDNAKAAMREMAAILGLEVDPAWTTRQLGAKLLKMIGSEPAEKPVDNSAAQQAAAAAAAKAEAEKAAAAALAEKEKAEATKAEAEKAEQERVKAKAAKRAAETAAAAAKEAVDKAKAELERQKAEAEAAKAELERIKAEAAKAQAEAEAARAAAEKAAAEKAKAEADAAKPAASGANNGALTGLFSVATNKKVRFSMGNLQFNPKKYEFRFALHQYDRIGNDNTKIASNYDGWIDLFGYGTSGYMGCEPTETNIGNQYRQGDIANTNYDWGVYNPISNGGNKEGLWRTLTRDEWDYLFKTRANAGKLRARACVNGINGAIILPDDFYERRVRVPFDSTPSGFSGNSYDLTQWATMEAAGAIFLPCCGKRGGTEMVESPEGDWSYWTSSGFNGTYGGIPVARYANMFGTDNYVNCYYGRAVRLVQDVK